MADDVEEFVQVHGLERIVLIGHSMHVSNAIWAHIT